MNCRCVVKAHVRQLLMLAQHTVPGMCSVVAAGRLDCRYMASCKLVPSVASAMVQVLYEAALWHLLEIFFLHGGISDGFFVEVSCISLHISNVSIDNWQPLYDQAGPGWTLQADLAYSA